MNSTLMTKRQIAEILKFLNDVYPSVELTQSRIDTWAKLLKDQNPAVVMKNAERYAMENKFPPSIAQLRENKTESRNKDFVQKVREWEGKAVGSEHGSGK